MSLPMKVLIVEDELDGQQVVEYLLEFRQIASDKVASAEEALSLLTSTSRYDGVVIDLALPGMDGFQLLQAIRRQEELTHLPCIAITAYHSSAVRQEAITQGFDAYFPKPLDEIGFADSIWETLQKP